MNKSQLNKDVEMKIQIQLIQICKEMKKMQTFKNLLMMNHLKNYF